MPTYSPPGYPPVGAAFPAEDGSWFASDPGGGFSFEIDPSEKRISGAWGTTVEALYVGSARNGGEPTYAIHDKAAAEDSYTIDAPNGTKITWMTFCTKS